MAENIVQSLFGPMPYEIDAARRQQDMDYASKIAAMNNIQQAKLGIGQGAAGLARSVGGMFGMVDPAQQAAEQREQTLSGINMSDWRSIAEAAMRTQDPRMKMQLGLLAQQQKAKEDSAMLAARKVAVDERKQVFAEKEALDFKYAKLAQDYELAKQRAEDSRLAAADRAAAQREANQIRLQIAQMTKAMGPVKTQIVTDESGKSTLVDLRTGETVRELGKIGKPSGTYEKTREAEKATVRGIGDAESAIDQMLGSKQNPGLLYKATGSGVGTAVDYAARLVGKATEGDVANAKIQPLADAVLKIVPRFEGPQSDKDTASYKEAAGNLANPNLPNELRIEAAKTIKEIYTRRKNQFAARGFENVEPQQQSTDMPPPGAVRRKQ